MANEFKQLPNPTPTPETASTGYGRQNTNLLALQVGLDTLSPHDNGAGVITVPSGGIINTDVDVIVGTTVDLNGVMSVLLSDLTFTKPNAATAYWIAVIPNADGTASAALVTRPGTYNYFKRGCYTTTAQTGTLPGGGTITVPANSRTLDWVSLGTPAGPLPAAAFTKTTKGAFEIQLPKGWYYAQLASGLGGGNGTAGGNVTGTAPGAGGSGGIANTPKTAAKLFFYDGKRILRGIVGGTGWNGGSGGTGYRSGVTNGNGAGGGGGGSGSGESTSFDGWETGEVPGGNGGNGGNINNGGNGGGGGGGGGRIGGSGGTGTASGSYGGNGTSGSSSGSNGGSGGIVTAGSGMSPGNGGVGAPGTGGGGGGQGARGIERADGEPGGYCNIILLAA